MKICVGTPLIARKNDKKSDIANNDTFTIKEIRTNEIVLDTDVVIPLSEFSRLFHVAFCITIHKAQGQTFTESYTIHEWNKLDRRLKYVALSRGTCIENINILD